MSSTALKALTATTGNKTDCWNTPKHVLDDVVEFFGGSIGLDPCSDDKVNPNVPCERWYTEEDDGLSQEWDAPTVFMNHPYSASRVWVPYAVEQQAKHGNEMLLLIKQDISTKWWRAISDRPFLAYNCRLRFGAAASAAPFQSALVYLGTRDEEFCQFFSKRGFIYRPFTST